MDKQKSSLIVLSFFICMLSIPNYSQGKRASNYEVIIIGAGAGGLSAGATLSQSGVKTLVLEQHDKPGGYMTTFERGDYRFEVSTHMMDGLGPDGPTRDLFKKLGILDKVQLIKLDPVYRLISQEFTADIPGDRQAYLKLLTEKFPHEADGLTDLFNSWDNISEDVGGLKYLTEASLPYKIFVYPLVPFLYFGAITNLNSTSEEMVNDYLTDPIARAVILQMSPFLGTPPSRSNGLYYVYMWDSFFKHGAYYFAGGSQAVSNALAAVIRENRGEVRLNTRVEKIIIKDGRAIGVRTQSGDEIYANYIISNADARQTYLKLVGENYLDPEYVEYIKGLEQGVSSVCVYLGLDIDLKKTPLANVSEIFYTPGSLKDYDTQWNDLQPLDPQGMGIGLYSNIDPTCAPPGKSTVVLLQMAHYDWENQWRRNQGDKAYQELKTRVADAMINKVEKLIPGLRNSIEEIEIGTPLTMERYTSSYKGSWIGWATTEGQVQKERMKQEGPIDNLYLAGAWTYPSGGQSACMDSGWSTGNKILKKLR